MGERKISPLYRLIKAAVRAVYPKIKVVGEENLPPEPVVYVGNHSQMNGPIACELYTPGSGGRFSSSIISGAPER